jgi:hypothetical protein
MPTPIRFSSIVAFAGLLLIAATACNTTNRRAAPAAGTAEPERAHVSAAPTSPARSDPSPDPARAEPVMLASADEPPAPPTTAATTPAPDAQAQREAEAKAKQEAEEKARKEAKEDRDRLRKLAKLEKDLETARLRLSKTRLDHEHAELRFNEAQARTKVDLDLARQKLQQLKEVTQPNRIARSELNLAWGQDGLLEAQEELQQLELMYNEEEFADKTKEIVIDRARRRLERTQRDLELRRDEHKILLELSIPMETREHELAVEDKQRELANMTRDEASAKLDRQLAIMGAEAEITRLENEASDVREDIKEAADKKAAAQQAQSGPAQEP